MTEKQKLNPQAERILEILEDKGWHCPIDWKYSDGHGKRLTDINRFLKPLGEKLDWDWCDCGRHTAQVKKRRIISLSQPLTHDKPETPRPVANLKPSEVIRTSTYKSSIQEKICPECSWFMDHSATCPTQIKQIKQTNLTLF